MNEFINKVKEFVLANKKAVMITGAAVLAAVIILVVVLLLIGGGNNGPVGPQPTTPTVQTEPPVVKTAYKVSVQNRIGTALPGIPVSIYADETLMDMVGFGKTDENGMMTFSAEASEGYVAVLDNLPAGYAVAQTYPVTADTQIVLSAAGSSVADTKDRIHIGDPVPNFTVTTLDGATYTLSNLIEQGKPVILNFWYESCEPCKAEFPHMQEAYAEFTDEAVLLALNLDDSLEKIQNYQQTSGIDLPFAVGDQNWRDLLGIIANPTTAVIDRFGHLSLVHVGTLPETRIFTSLFELYTDPNYQHTTFDFIDDIMMGVPGDTAENPLEFSGDTSYHLLMEPGQTIHCAFYRVDGMLMSIANENVTVTYNGETYSAVDGWVKLLVNSPDTFTPVSVAINNLGGQKEFDVDFSYVPGSVGAPFELNMGAFQTEIAAGNEQGVYYTYTCDASGKLSVSILGATEGVEYNVVLFNQTSTIMVSSMDCIPDPETGIITLSVDVNSGDVVQMVAATMMDAELQFPAAVLDLEAAFVDGEGTVNYSVIVTDKNGYAIPGVSLTITGADVDMDVTTNANGEAGVALVAGTYSVIPNIPLGYQAEATSFQLTQDAPVLFIVLEQVSSNPTEQPTDPDDLPTEPSDPTLPSDTVPTQPGTTDPTDPVQVPTEPGVVTPTQPVVQPTDPTDPVVRPTTPVVRPTTPVVRPTDPTDKPTDPTVRPTDPTVKPTDPTVRPTDPTVRPTDPTVRPIDPIVRPTDPTVRPTDPTVRPTDPTVKPTDPTVRPTDPTVRPTDPTVRPTEPTVRPTEPVVTQPPATEPPATQPPATEPPATQPPVTDPPATEPPETEPEVPTYTPDPDVAGETRENPMMLGSRTSYTIEVKAGYTIYIEIHPYASTNDMTVSGGDFELVINAPVDDRAKVKTPDENGVFSQTVESNGTTIPLYLDLTNTTGKDKTYTISFAPVLGSWDNPEKITLDEESTLKVKKGNDVGYYYAYTAKADGVFTLTCLDCTSGVIYGMTITNNGDGGQDSIPEQFGISSEMGNSVSVAVKAGDKLMINVCAVENDFGPYPKATFKLFAEFEEA